ncbi:MAG: TetR/AcrR family transcriptional regulator, partial [Bacteroidota bacterium]
MAYTEIKSKRQEILEVAGYLFREKGYTATHMKDIAEKVNMEAASLYNHINSKHEILRDLLMYVAYKFQNGMKNIIESSYSDFEKIKAIIALHIRLTTENPHCISLLTKDWKHLKETDLKAFKQIRVKYSEDFLSIVKSAMENGEIKKANPEITLNSILSSVRWLY